MWLSSTLLALVATCAGYVFSPDDSSTYINTRVPTLYNMTNNQYDDKPYPGGTTSYWTSTYLTTTNGKQYLSISHILTSAVDNSLCRSLILDLSSLQIWKDSTYCDSHVETEAEKSAPLDLDLGGYGFVATSIDSISSMYTFGSGSGFSYNISYDASTKVLLNGGNGVIGFGPDYTNATEWSLPSCKTKGSITLNSTKLTIDPLKSLTWYDRQISAGVPQNWTWFQLHFPSQNVKASIWAYDFPASLGKMYRFATVRVGQESQYVVAYTLSPSTTNTWTSPASNITYPLSWRLNFENGDYLDIQSVRPDQELYGSRMLAHTAYEGFVNASGSFMGQKNAFGVVEMVRVF